MRKLIEFRGRICNSILLIFLLAFCFPVSAQILPERERAQLIEEIQQDRFDNLLPKLMDRTEIDMWLVIAREYNEDPVLKTMLPPTWLNARRRTILVFYRNKEQDSLERLAVARYDVGKNISSAWNPEKQPEQWEALIQIIKDRNPGKIGLNYSEIDGIADGLVKTDYDEFMEALPQEFHSKIVSAEDLAISWIETRSEKEMEIYPELVQITKDIIREAFSNKVIDPGETSTEDVVWWMRQKVTDLGLETWFHPTVAIQRDEDALQDHVSAFSSAKERKVIMPGDLIHCDFGISYLGLNTDCQQMAYVLKAGKVKLQSLFRKHLKKAINYRIF